MMDRVEDLLGILTQDDTVNLLKGANKNLEPKAAVVYLKVSALCLEEWRKKKVLARSGRS